MNAAQRRKQNRINAQNSTGPKTEEGKEKSRQNAMTHGLTAEELTLPEEKPEVIQAHAEAWFEAIKPEDHQEAMLAEQAIVCSLRIQRYARVEAAVASDQVLEAEIQWDRAEDLKLLDLRERLQIDPGRAVVELGSFGKGVEWLLAQFRMCRNAFLMAGGWHSIDAINEVLRLQGYNPAKLRSEENAAYEFFLHSLACSPLPLTHPGVVQHVEERRPTFFPNQGMKSSEVAGRLVVEKLDGIIARLEKKAEVLGAARDAGRGNAVVRAQMPRDTPENRLMLRYLKSAETSLDRTVRTVAKLQADRREQARIEAEIEVDEEPSEPLEVNSRNEPELRAKATTKRLDVGTWITIGRKKFEVCDSGDGYITLGPRPLPTRAELEAAAAADLEAEIEPVPEV